MSLERIYLESFEADEEPLAQESADYKRGFEAAALASQEASQTAIETALKEVSSTLSDMEFGFEEARSYLSHRLHHLLVQLAETALPSIIMESFGAHLNDVIETHFADLTGHPIQILVSPEVEAKLTEGQAGQTSRFRYIADPTLSAGQAVLRKDDSHVMLNLPALLEALQSTLSSFDTIERKETHG